jgi:FkbM family methyltransferase
LVLQGFYDVKTQYILTTLLKEGDCFIDVGANVGAMTFNAASRVGTNGLVYAFEPGPIHFKMLTQTVANSNIKNVKLYNLGCSKDETNLFWKMDEKNPGNAQISKFPTDISVKVIKLEQVIPETQKVHIIKIDVEGMELEVLEGAERIIIQSKPLMIIETNTGSQNEVKKTNQVLDYLKKANFEFYSIKNAESELIAFPDTQIKLMSVSFPDVPQNVLCIHKECKHHYDNIIL